MHPMIRSYSRVLFSIVLLTFLLAADSARAGGGPENVVVVVNAESWASRTIANEYVRLRGIPPVNVIALEGVPDHDTISVDLFRTKILIPVLATIKARRLGPQVDYVAWSSDFPSAINVKSDVGDQELPRVLTPTASINGLTYLYQPVLAKNAGYLNLNANGYMRRVVTTKPRPPLSGVEMKSLGEAMKSIQEKKWDGAASALKLLRDAHPTHADIRYNLACCLARMKKADEALEELKHAVRAGWTNHRHSLRDDDLRSLREKTEFKKLIERMKAATFDVQPSVGFRSMYVWDGAGRRVSAGGRSHLLSTMLAITSGRGTSVDEGLASLRRSVSADGTAPRGTFYFVENSNVRSTTREGYFDSAVAALKKGGLQAEIVSGKLPQKKNDVLGAVIGAASFDWKASGSTMLPGAICEHLTSLGGVMRENSGQTPLSELIRHGAAGSSGTVTEPFAIQAKFPLPFLHVHYARGCSLAEAFYQSVSGPYQLLIVGDPLCRPFADAARVKVSGFDPAKEVDGTLELRASATGSQGEPATVDHFEVFINGLRLGIFGASEAYQLDTGRLPDGAHELRIVAVLLDPLETQARAILPLRVNHRDRSVSVEGPASGRLTWNQPVSISAEAEGASRVMLVHNREVLASANGERVEWKVDSLSPGRFGFGTIAVRSVARYDAPTPRDVLSPVLSLTVEPGKHLRALKVVDESLVPGLAVTVGGESAKVVTETLKPDWLQQLKPQAGDSLKVTGFFTVPSDAVYQFVVRGSFSLSVTVDESELTDGTSGDWSFLPVPLKKGRHRLTLRGSLPEKPRLQVRFGGQGTHSLSGATFSASE